MNPLVSVVLPAFNCEETIEQTLNSVRIQTIESIEIIVIDDCSADNTNDIICRIALTDDRIRLYRNSNNLGVANARNVGCGYATGKYIAFIDSDDMWQREKLEKQLREMERTGSDLSYTSYYIIFKNNRTLYSAPVTIDYHGLLKENVIGCSTVMLRAELMSTYKFNSAFFHEDYVLWLTLLRNGYKAVGIQEALVDYRKGGRSSNKFKAARNRWLIYRKYEKLPLLKSVQYMFAYARSAITKYV